MVKAIKWCLRNEQECFIGFKTTRGSQVVLDPIKHVLRVFWTASAPDDFKNILQKACVLGVRTKVQIVRERY